MANKKSTISIAALLVIIFLSVAQFSPVKAIAAFPGAEGFGATSVGGRGGTVYEVTNLNDSGTGSLRSCVIASVPRTCVFKVGGTITLNSQLTISNPYITIAGQTAPGGGILLRKALGAGGDLITSKTHDVIIRYISGRVGPGGDDHVTQLASNNSTSLYNIIYDHCSFSWGVDSVWETWYRVYDTTIQWSFINEGLDNSTHSKGAHSKGLMIGGYKLGESTTEKGSYNVSVHHNLMAHDAERAPLMQFCGNGQVINNITYNAAWTFSHQEINCADPAAVSIINWIGNYYKKGPSSTSNTQLKVSVTGGTSTGRAYVKGNIGPGRANDSLPETNGTSISSGLLATSPVDAPAIATSDALTAYNNLLAEGGAGNSKGLNCDGSWTNRRDAVDKRNVAEVKNAAGKIIDAPWSTSCLGSCLTTSSPRILTLADYTKYGISESEVGVDGWPVIASGIACIDTDKDGMPDTWESSHGLNPNSATDGTQVSSSGYTNLEDYLSGSTSSSTPSPSPSPSPSVKPGDANGDTKVDGIDYVVWLNHYNQSTSNGHLNGDYNNSGIVDGVDYVIWMNNYGK